MARIDGRRIVSSGLVPLASSPAVVAQGQCILMAAHVYTDGTNDATLTVYDSSAGASGTVLARLRARGADLQVGEGGIEVHATNGLVVELSGSGSSGLVRYVLVSPKV